MNNYFLFTPDEESSEEEKDNFFNKRITSKNKSLNRGCFSCFLSLTWRINFIALLIYFELS
jgi:hypothetical protein